MNERDVILLIVGPVEDMQNSKVSVFSQFPWYTHHARTCGEALFVLREDAADIVVCEQNLPDGTWRAVLDAAASRSQPPPVIVTSRLADDRLWAEVLNLGGYDVLAKPLDPTEVYRTLTLARARGTSRREAGPGLGTATEEAFYVRQLG